MRSRAPDDELNINSNSKIAEAFLNITKNMCFKKRSRFLWCKKNPHLPCANGDY